MIDDKDRQRYQGDSFIVAYPGLGMPGRFTRSSLSWTIVAFKAPKKLPEQRTKDAEPAMRITAVDPILLKGSETYNASATGNEATDNGDWQLIIKISTDEV
ncbi:MAG: hypothetical protein EBQ71_01605 [Betaproteobacteria bacterium]|nr:hypothetical protein [Betaproteobacteria bacterium]